jgi:uncharacterized protein YaeQ
MALKSTVFKVELQVTDVDRHYYAPHSLVLARHPSETDERMMVRVLAFALNADPRLTFGNGLSSAEEPDLLLQDLSGERQHWIDVGLPDPKWLRKACGRARRVSVYGYGRNAHAWWVQHRQELARCDNLAVFALAQTGTEALSRLATRTMRLQCYVQDGVVSIAGDDGEAVTIEMSLLQPSSA